MKRKHAPETAEAVTLEEVRAAVRWAPLPPRQLDYGAALLEVPRGRVATPFPRRPTQQKNGLMKNGPARRASASAALGKAWSTRTDGVC